MFGAPDPTVILCGTKEGESALVGENNEQPKVGNLLQLSFAQLSNRNTISYVFSHV